MAAWLRSGLPFLVSFSLFVCMLYAFSYATVKEGWTVHGMMPLSTVVFGCVTLVGFSVGRYGA